MVQCRTGTQQKIAVEASGDGDTGNIYRGCRGGDSGQRPPCGRESVVTRDEINGWSMSSTGGPCIDIARPSEAGSVKGCPGFTPLALGGRLIVTTAGEAQWKRCWTGGRCFISS